MCFARTFEALATLDEMIRKDLDYNVSLYEFWEEYSNVEINWLEKFFDLIIIYELVH